ncbi:MAG: DUF5683 domain-containing protein [Microscillaceae bacterium]|nr:DUF5683 domain-containing protein [Microscillaceae bacterium]MDW8461601.1 DUF5683 domain-containing protein [Cytophagales bacterium]
MSIKIYLLTLFGLISWIAYGQVERPTQAQIAKSKVIGNASNTSKKHYSESLIFEVDSIAYQKPLRSPRKAALYSALLPGLGQIYNRKYWKVPIVLGAGAVVGSIIDFNVKQYRKFREAFEIKVHNANNPTNLRFDPYPAVTQAQIQRVRNTAQQNMELSIIVAVVVYGLNIVDAAVDAHLSGFDVSEKLSIQFKPTSHLLGLAIALYWK